MGSDLTTVNKKGNWNQMASKKPPVSAIVVGAGGRGNNYAYYSMDFPSKLKIVAVCEPREFRRTKFTRNYKISEDFVFTDWKECLKKEKFADCVFICTQDQQHKEPAVAFAKKGYHILLEKPMAVTEADCNEIVETCKKHGVMLAVCHVLRYTPQAQKIKQLIESGAIGDVVNIQLLEPVGHWHFAHSYVRGNWRNTQSSTFSLLAKSCHDLDLLLYWSKKTSWNAVSSFGSLKHFNAKNKVGHWHFAHSFVRGNWRHSSTSCFSLLQKSCHDLDLLSFWSTGKRCSQVSSFGSLKHFRKNNKPENAGSRCLDCAVEETCPYSAKRIYLDSGRRGWPVSVITDVPDIENITEALKTGPYGRCVYDCDNNVCDNQVVNLQFEDGSTASFSMVAFTEKICQRQVRVFGTKGELSCDFSYMTVTHNDFVTHKKFEYNLNEESELLEHTMLQGHGGADFFAMDSFVTAIREGDDSKILTGPDESLASHILCFKAEQARLENRVITLS